MPDGAEAGVDYRAISTFVTIAPGDFSAADGGWEVRKTVAVSIVDDSVAESDEDFQALLRGAPGLPSWVSLRAADGTSACGSNGCLMTVTIGDNDNPPSAPQALAATPGDEQATLTWQAPASDGGSAVTGYEYRHAAGASVPDETAWSSAGTGLTATVASLVNGTAYAFEVRAVNDAGAGEAALTTATPATVPSAPQALAATPGDEQATLTWQAPASDGGSAVTGYEYRHAAGASVPDETAWSSAGTSLTARSPAWPTARPMPSRCGR